MKVGILDYATLTMGVCECQPSTLSPNPISLKTHTQTFNTRGLQILLRSPEVIRAFGDPGAMVLEIERATQLQDELIQDAEGILANKSLRFPGKVPYILRGSWDPRKSPRSFPKVPCYLKNPKAHFIVGIERPFEIVRYPSCGFL